MFKLQIKGITIETDDPAAVVHLIDAYGVKQSDAPSIGKVSLETLQPQRATKKPKMGHPTKSGGTRDAVTQRS